MSNYRPLHPAEVTRRLKALPVADGTVTPEMIESEIGVVKHTFIDPNDDGIAEICICCIVMKNGFVSTGEAILSDPDRLDVELAKHFSYLDARRKLMGIYQWDRKEYDFVVAEAQHRITSEVE